LRSKTGLVWTALFFFWFTIILFLALQQGDNHFESTVLGWDKFQHAAAFGLLTLLGGKSLQSWLPIRRAWLVAFFVAVLLGGVVEVAQASLTTYRSGDWLDLFADSAGAALVCALALLYNARSR
jgi:VanZ family protein